ncbi:hypothetical protein GGD38_007347 [Chitinophagaceae bacterium OAS944]|nr:hypothetical protein [Chitinophagaceae bacterium OAS944]
MTETLTFAPPTKTGHEEREQRGSKSKNNKADSKYVKRE